MNSQNPHGLGDLGSHFHHGMGGLWWACVCYKCSGYWDVGPEPSFCRPGSGSHVGGYLFESRHFVGSILLPWNEDQFPDIKTKESRSHFAALKRTLRDSMPKIAGHFTGSVWWDDHVRKCREPSQVHSRSKTAPTNAISKAIPFCWEWQNLDPGWPSMFQGKNTGGNRLGRP